MQTFLPYEDFKASAEMLDSRRLNKQLLEGRQIYGILASNKSNGAWVNHPAVVMWRGHDLALWAYLLTIRIECDCRGVQTAKNWSAITDIHEGNPNRKINVLAPPWLGDERVHLSHRQNLYVKDQTHYAIFEADSRLPKAHCCDKCNYVWPTKKHGYPIDF